MPDPLDGQPLALRLHALAGAGLLRPEALARALELTGRRPTAEAWYRFARFQLIILGTVLVVVGAIFFIAANWDVFTPAVRMGLAAAAMSIATLAGGWIGLDRLSGRSAALAGGLLFGPLLALVGQVYQTGADAYELFFAWSLVMVAYAFAIRFAGAWLVAMLLAIVTAYLWMDQALGSDPSQIPGLWVSLGVAVGLAAIGLVRRLRQREPGLDVVGLTALALAWFSSFLHGAVAIVMRGWPPGQLLAFLWSIALPAALIAVSGKVRDPGLARLGGAALFGLLAVAEGKIVWDILDLEEAGLLVMGVLLIGQGYLGGQWLLASRRQPGHASAGGEP